MDRVAEHPMVVEAEQRVGGALVQVARFTLADPVDSVVLTGDEYRLNFCLTPRPLETRAGFPDRWGPHRFEAVGDMFLSPPDSRLHIRGRSGRQLSVIVTWPANAIERWLDGPVDWTDRRLEASLDVSSPLIRAAMSRLAGETLRPGIGAARLVELTVGTLAIELARYCAAIEDRPITGGLAGWRLRAIEERLRDLDTPPTLEDLAALCSLSVRQLTRGFRASRGCSIAEYVDHARMEGAKRLLAGSDSIKAIAFAMGYASPSSFAFAFRRATGITPRGFRQRVSRPLS